MKPAMLIDRSILFNIAESGFAGDEFMQTSEENMFYIMIYEEI